MSRGKGEGSVYKRLDGVWAASIELPPREYGADGKPKRRRKVVTHKDKATVLRLVRELRNRLEVTGDLPTASLTVTQWADYWMREVVVKTRRPKTVASYASVVNGWVKPQIGGIRLDKVTPSTIRRVLSAMDTAGKSSTYARNAHSIMSAMLADAERDGRIPRNPVELVVAPRKAATHLNALTPAESAKLIGSFQETPAAFLWATFLLTGARRGEILGLEWDRVTVDLDLSWQLQRFTDGMVFPDGFEYRPITGSFYWTRPKTSTGWRVVPLVDPLLSILTRWRTLTPPNPHGLVFTTAQGLPIDPDDATKTWPAVLAAAGIKKKVRLHDLRHTTVDLLLEAGVPEDIVMEIVGHSSRAMTRAYKSRGNRGRLSEAMRDMSALLAAQV